MKRRFLIMTMFLFCIFTLSGCCRHQWQEAVCDRAEFCTLCEKERGNALGHSWQEATCEQATICVRCGLEDGNPLGHDWVWIGCGEKDICSRCGTAGDTSQQHSWQANCGEPITCIYCGTDSGNIQQHSWETDSNSDYCTYCGQKKLCLQGHTWERVDCEIPRICSACHELADEEPRGEHSWSNITCTSGGHCYLCGQTAPPLGHDWQDDPCGSCSRCDETQDGSFKHVWTEATCLNPRTCTVCGKISGYASNKHFFDAWKQTGNAVNRSCMVCGIQDMGGTIDPTNYDTYRAFLFDIWTAKEDQTLTIRKDGTFSGNFDGEVTGTWELYGVLDYRFIEDLYRFGLNLRYTKDGKENVISGSFVISVNGNRYNYIRIYLDDLFSYYNKTDRSYYEQEEFEDSEKTTLPVGTWTSFSIIRNWTHPYENFTEISTDYFVEIFEDGTFTAHLLQGISGKLEIGEYSEIKYDYKTDDGNSAGLTIWHHSENELDIGSYGTDEMIMYQFTHMTEAEKQAYLETHRQNETTLYNKIVGEWVAYKYTNADVDNDCRVMVHSLEDSPYHLTFCSDGTFYGTVMHGEIFGTWFYSGVQTNKNGDAYKVGITYNYDDHSWGSYNVYLDKDGLYMQMFTTGGILTSYFEKH